MAAKQLKYDQEARQAILNGVEKLSRAVKVTLGREKMGFSHDYQRWRNCR